MADKTKRYDRQLRIWGSHGQRSLESAKICLLDAGPTGSETLKNLVLGGIAGFTIVDDKKVTARDLGNNFLISAESLGTSRAQCVTDLLKELNDSVDGSFVEESPATLVASHADFFKRFTLVIATQMQEADVVKLEEITRAQGVLLLVARSYGLVGYVRISRSEHRVIESKPDNVVEDLRFHQPWPELDAYARSIDVASADESTHGHIPYAVLLIQAAQQWAAEHGGSLPSTYKERSAFKLLLKSHQRQIDGIPIEEENFNEAILNAHKMWAPPSLPAEVKAILDDAESQASPTSDDFWIMAAALKRFVDNEGQGYLPLEGSIPDMTATTALFLELQRIYRDKAEADVEAVAGHVAAVLQAARRSPKSIPRATIKHFCKHCRNLRVVRYRTHAEEAGRGAGRADVIRQALAAEDSAANMSLAVLLRAADRFHATSNRYPGCFAGALEEDLPALKAIALQVLSDAGVGNAPLSDDIVGEICRFGATELHCVAAVVGGMASQEAIKLITHQFVPLSGTLIYNAMASTTSVFKF